MAITDWALQELLKRLSKEPMTIKWLGFTITILAKEDSK